MGYTLYDLSQTDASNTTFAGITQAENSMTPGVVNNMFRAKDGAVARLLADLGAVNTIGGTGDVITVTLAQGFTAYGTSATQIPTGAFFRFIASAANTTNVTINVNAIGAKAVRKISGGTDVALVAGDLAAGETYTVVYRSTANAAAGAWVIVGAANVPNATTSVFGTVKLASSANVLAPPVGSTLVPTIPDLYFPTDHISGLTIINNAGSAANKIDVAVGTCRDSTDTANMIQTAAITAKDITSAWAVGSTAGLLDTGAVANTTYYVYEIKRPDTGVVDVIASTSSSAPTLPTNYTLYRKIGYFVRASATNGTPRNYNRPQIEYSGSAPVFACRAWVYFNGTGTVAINGSGNVSSITDNGTGDWTVNFTTSMPDANFAANVTGQTQAAVYFGYIGVRATATPYAVGSIRICATDSAGTASDVTYINVSIFR